MEKRLVFAIVLCLLILLGWNWLASTLWPPPPRPVAAVRQGTPVAAPRPGDPPPAPQPESPGAPEGAETTGRIEAARVHAVVSSRGGGTLRDVEVWGCAHHEPEDRKVAGDPGRVTTSPAGREGALAVDIYGAGPDVSGLGRANWELRADGDGWIATIERGGVRVVRTLRPSADAAHPYHFEATVEVTNVAARPDAACVLEFAGFWMPEALQPIPEDGVIIAPGGGSPEQLLASGIAEKLAEEPNHERRSESGWRFAGVRSDFYLGAVVPREPLPADAAVSFRAAREPSTLGPNRPPHETACATLRAPFSMPAAGASKRWSFLVYAGPNSRTLLTEPGSPYAVLADAFPNRSFLGLSFGPIARFLGWLLSVLANSFGLGWGVAVCVLTVLVRGALFPLSRKSQISMRLHAQRMQKLKPKLDAMKEKHKDNPKKQQEETMRLFREEKVSILPGGCLLAFLQMPVWISLYATLQTTFEMRHAGFLWFDDLTAPDHLMEVPWLAGVWGLGSLTGGWFNLLPLLMMVTWWGSAAMTPLPEDPEQRSQAKMMRWIPLLFGVFLYQTAAGLTLYMTLSALWSIGETWLIRKLWLNDIVLAPAKK